jgi:hypothetical protein
MEEYSKTQSEKDVNWQTNTIQKKNKKLTIPTVQLVKEARKNREREQLAKLKENISAEATLRIMQGKAPFIKKNIKLLYFSGFKRNRISYTRLALKNEGLMNEAILGISFIGKSILELTIKMSQISQTVEVCEKLVGKLLRNFNPLKRNTYEGDTREIELKNAQPKDKFCKRMENTIKRVEGQLGCINSSKIVMKKILKDFC